MGGVNIAARFACFASLQRLNYNMYKAIMVNQYNFLHFNHNMIMYKDTPLLQGK